MHCSCFLLKVRIHILTTVSMNTRCCALIDHCNYKHDIHFSNHFRGHVQTVNMCISLIYKCIYCSEPLLCMVVIIKLKTWAIQDFIVLYMNTKYLAKVYVISSHPPCHCQSARTNPHYCRLHYHCHCPLHPCQK